MKRYGGSAGNSCRSIIPTQDGGYFIGGSSNSEISGVKTEGVIGFNDDYWVIKTDSQGTIEWQKTIGGGRFFAFSEEFGEVLNVVRQTSDGGYLLGGSSDSPIFGNKTEATYGLEDFWIVKLDSTGNILWQKDIGGDSADDLYVLETTNDGGCILGGQSYSGISGNKTEESRGSYDYWVVKLDALGTIEWQKTIGGTETDTLSSIVVLENGNYLLAGFSVSNISGEKTENSKGAGDFWVLELDNQGAILWQKTIGGTDGDLLYKAIKTNDGFLLGGISTSNISFDKTENSRGDRDYWIVKINNEGTILWDKTYGGNDSDSLYDLQSSPNGGFVLVGVSYSPVSGDKTKPNFGICDGWVVRVNDDGNLLWQKSIGGIYEDGFNQVRVLPDNSIILSGSLYSPISGNITAPKYGVEDYLFVKLAPETLETVPFSLANCIVYPNPTTDNVTVAFKDFQKKVEVSVVTVLGQIVQENAFYNVTKIRLDLNGAKGIYFVNVVNENNEKGVFKVVKE